MADVARNPQLEATEALGGGLTARVLEPSPPNSTDSEWLADDPVNDGPGESATTVSPIGNAGRTWVDMVAERADLASFAQDRWLANYRRLLPLPADFATTRLSLHRIGAYLVSPARRQANDKIGLRYTMGGFGTPFFGDNEQVRVSGTEVVHQTGSVANSISITSLDEVGAALGTDPDVAWGSQFDIPDAGALDAPLPVSAASARALGDWYGFAWSVLEELRADEASVEASRPQLWPEHFDPAIEIGSDAGKKRASYGFSPGDAGAGDPGGTGEIEPYVYVGPWYPDDRPATDSGFWNGDLFPGAMLRYADLLEAEDQRQAALDFLRAGRDLLA